MKKYIKLMITLFTISLLHNFTFSQWVQTTSGTANFLTSVQSITGTINYAAGFAGTVLKSTNSGQTWSALTSPSASNINKIFFPPSGSATTGWVATTGIYKSTNAGVNWVQQVATGTFSDLAFIDLNTGFAVRTNLVAKTTNGGSNFTNSNYTSNSLVSANKIIFITGQTLMILGVDNANDTTFVFKSTNMGNTWTQIFKTPGVFFEMKFLNSNTGMMCGDNGVVRKTTNGGTAWTTVNTPASTDLLGLHFASSSIFYMVGSSGTILKSTNAGVNWLTQTCPVTANLRSVNVFPSDDNGIIVGAGGIILRTTNGGAFTSVIQNGTEIPENYSLSQNYPNPFNPSTKIKFSVAGTGNISIKVYDVMGKEVARVVDQNLTPGEYTADFDASSLPTGTYFYRLTAGSFTETKKLVLIK
jgi:photosystem II stability/assembly factor-like uncharacterized protein